MWSHWRLRVTKIGIVLMLSVIAAGCYSPANTNALSSEDRDALFDLLARYSQYIDAHQGDAFASTFVSDGELRFPGTDVKGRDGLAAFAVRADPNRFSVHFVGDVVLVPVGPGEVHARSVVILGRRAPNSQAARFDAFGVYEDDIRKTPAGWRFVIRRADVDLPISPEFLPSK